MLGSFVHLHVVALDGVFTRKAPGGAVEFHEGPAPSCQELAAVAARVAERMLRWMRRRKLLEERDAEERSNEAPDVSAPALCRSRTRASTGPPSCGAFFSRTCSLAHAAGGAASWPTSRSAMGSSRSSRISACPRRRRLSRGRGARASTRRDPTWLGRRSRRASGRTCARGAPPCVKCAARWGDRHVTGARPGVMAAGRHCGMGLTCLTLSPELLSRLREVDAKLHALVLLVASEEPFAGAA
jgi:hypothetical protein